MLRGLTQVIHRDRPFVLLELSPRGAQELGSQEAFNACFYDGAAVFLVSGRGRSFTYALTPYRFQTHFETLQELLVVPPEYSQVFYPTNESQNERPAQRADFSTLTPRLKIACYYILFPPVSLFGRGWPKDPSNSPNNGLIPTSNVNVDRLRSSSSHWSSIRRLGPVQRLSKEFLPRRDGDN